ncbi:hypothetical protein KKC97_13560 [bacterium]|nr:hypothetical protein [bacterium]MBU1638685.1 hypothetical protein [bacterium]
MKTLFAGILALLSINISLAQTESSAADLSTVLSLFSAHASNTGIRVNWSLDRQSPAIFGFRLYRGYASAGHFAVLTELMPHASNGSLAYAYTDTSAIPGVTYYYKLTSIGQSAESVFPVVISAAVTDPNTEAEIDANAPLALLPGEKIQLYVRKQGQVQLEQIEPEQRALVNDVLVPGIYEFTSPADGARSLLRLKHEDGFEADIQWPLQ